MRSSSLVAWVFVLVSCAISAYYLNWIAYGPAAQSDGSLGAVLKLGIQWYGIPAAIVIQLLIWLAMPRLFRLCPSVWVAALVWPLISAVCKVVILWNLKMPSRGDWVAIGGMFIAVVVGAIWR